MKQSTKETKEVNKFYEWLHRAGNVYMADVERMDRAIVNVVENVRSTPVNTGKVKINDKKFGSVDYSFYLCRNLVH